MKVIKTFHNVKSNDSTLNLKNKEDDKVFMIVVGTVGLCVVELFTVVPIIMKLFKTGFLVSLLMTSLVNIPIFLTLIEKALKMKETSYIETRVNANTNFLCNIRNIRNEGGYTLFLTRDRRIMFPLLINFKSNEEMQLFYDRLNSLNLESQVFEVKEKQLGVLELFKSRLNSNHFTDIGRDLRSLVYTFIELVYSMSSHKTKVYQVFIPEIKLVDGSLISLLNHINSFDIEYLTKEGYRKLVNEYFDSNSISLEYCKSVKESLFKIETYPIRNEDDLKKFIAKIEEDKGGRRKWM